jgi:putative ABC transport system permease protein
MAGVESIKYSLRNIKQRKSRNALTIFSILVGIATIFIFVSFGYGLYSYVEDFKTGGSANKILVMGKGGTGFGTGSPFILTEDDKKVVERTAGISSVTGAYFNVVKAEKNNEIKYVYIISYEPENDLLFEFGSIGIEFGRNLQKGEKKKVVAGYNYGVAGKIFERPLKLNEDFEVNGVKLKIVGFMEEVGNSADDAQLYITEDYYTDLFPNATSYQQIIAAVEDTDEIDLTIERVTKNLRKSRNQEEGKEDFFVQSFVDLIESFSQVLNIVIGFVILIALISIIVSAVNTANTMITSVLERYKEIGVLKAIGARNSEIFGIFLFESAFLGFIAGVLGVIFGAGISYGAGILLDSLGFGFLQPNLSIELFGGLILFSMLTGAISGAIPAWNASKINTVDALRYE